MTPDMDHPLYFIVFTFPCLLVSNVWANLQPCLDQDVSVCMEFITGLTDDSYCGSLECNKISQAYCKVTPDQKEKFSSQNLPLCNPIGCDSEGYSKCLKGVEGINNGYSSAIDISMVCLAKDCLSGLLPLCTDRNRATVSGLLQKTGNVCKKSCSQENIDKCLKDVSFKDRAHFGVGEVCKSTRCLSNVRDHCKGALRGSIEVMIDMVDPFCVEGCLENNFIGCIVSLDIRSKEKTPSMKYMEKACLAKKCLSAVSPECQNPLKIKIAKTLSLDLALCQDGCDITTVFDCFQGIDEFPLMKKTCKNLKESSGKCIQPIMSNCFGEMKEKIRNLTSFVGCCDQFVKIEEECLNGSLKIFEREKDDNVSETCKEMEKAFSCIMTNIAKLKCVTLPENIFEVAKMKAIEALQSCEGEGYERTVSLDTGDKIASGVVPLPLATILFGLVLAVTSQCF